MKEYKEIITSVTVILLTLIIVISVCAETKESHRHIEECKRIERLTPPDPIHDTTFIATDFPRLMRALIEIESRGNPDAVNPTSGASGLMQLMPIYVREANRILGKDVYSLKDRFDPVKTLEMFCIIQDHHNPSQNIDRAIKLHNSSPEYYRLVKKTIY